MAVYKVIQDIEAEDKLIGPLTLKQFIFFCIALAGLYMSVLSIIKNFPLVMLVTVPISGVAGLLAAPLSKVQPTEVLIAARVRFFLKPRRRIWDQTGLQELVTITVPKIEHPSLTKNLTQDQVQSRLKALAHTLDSRGWAVKNLAAPMLMPAGAAGMAGGYSGQGYAGASYGNYGNSERLLSMSHAQTTGGQGNVRDDLDPQNSQLAQRFETQIRAAEQRIHQQAISAMHAPTPIPNSAPRAQAMPAAPAAPTVSLADGPAAPRAARAADVNYEDVAVIAQTRASQNTAPTSHLKTLQPTTQAPKVTPPPSPAILELAQNNDFSVATIAAQAKRQNDTEVVVDLH